MHNFVQSYDQVDDSQAQYSSLYIRASQKGTQARVLEEQVVILPEREPGYENQEAPNFQGIENIKDRPERHQARAGTQVAAVFDR
jgi:hypothetical protein